MKKVLSGKLHIMKLQGIAKRWFINVVGLIFLFLIIIFVVASFSVKAYYYDSVKSLLYSGASTTAVSYFKTNLDLGVSLEDSAARFVDSYTYKDKTTVWIVDNNGNIIASSDGFLRESPEMPDYSQAVSSEDGISEFVGRANGEKIMSVSRVIENSQGIKVGAVRVMASLKGIDWQIFGIIVFLFVSLIAIIIIIIFSNMIFMRSIIVPIREITATTKEISNGNLDVRIEKKYDDEIGRLSDSINSMASDIADADKLKNDFISTISHELRTPLTSIKGWGETLLFGLDQERDPVTNKGLQIIVSESGRLEGFVEELLDFSRLQSGRMNLRLVKTDIFAELDETVFTFRERAMREGIEVRYSIPDFPAPANADPNRLKQVFMNILDNALKYSKIQGKIFVKAEFSTFNGGDAVKISIADQGCGISEEDLPHVMEKFYKANDTVRGSGIGLAVTNEIVNLHNGKLEIDSKQNGGTLVTIYLPVDSVPTKQEIDMSEPKMDEVSDDDIKLKGYNS